MKYLTRRHQKLMDASEFALREAARVPQRDDSRIANRVLQDGRTFRSWESCHADLLQPVARQRKDNHLLAELRRSQMALVHRRSLFRYLNENSITGEKRRRLFNMFHSTLDFEAAVLVEHKQFMFAVSSRISSQYITQLMDDSAGDSLLQLYEDAYAHYFDLKCSINLATSKLCADMVSPFLNEARDRTLRIRQRIETEKPRVIGHSFEVQEALARSGRYRALNYLNS